MTHTQSENQYTRNDKDMFIDISISADSNAINHAKLSKTRVDHISSAFFFFLFFLNKKLENKMFTEVFHIPHYIHCEGGVVALTGHYRVREATCN